MAKRLVRTLVLACIGVLGLLYLDFVHLHRFYSAEPESWQIDSRPGSALVQVQEEVVPFVYVASELTEFVVYCLRATRRYHPGVPLLVVISGEAALSIPALKEVLRLPGVQVKLMEHFLTPGTDAHTFGQRYIHHSVVAEDFERFCFQRFFILRDIAVQEGYSRFFHLDHDMVLFADQADFLRSPADIVALSTHSTFFSVWRLPALNRFCDHMLHFYTRPQAAVEADWERFGEAMNATFHQFSDMYMLYSFVTAAQEAGQPVSQHLLVYDLKGELTPDYRAYYALMNLQQYIGWDCDLAEFRRVVEWRIVGGAGLLLPHVNGTALAGIHFQGHFCKQIATPVLDWALRAMDTVDSPAEQQEQESENDGGADGTADSGGHEAEGQGEGGGLGNEGAVAAVAAGAVVQAESREGADSALVRDAGDPVKETDVMAVMTGDWAVFKAEGQGRQDGPISLSAQRLHLRLPVGAQAWSNGGL
ncbi:hypothetical protein KFL_006250070 [Klebsormidium nitens]|uniref:Uncharacterized protein n=1 Tax=Klebsormidium nitens TaxID=105231 RepID=A0A1Y1IHY3_KLENI|nr:hypothetical protein KFL_006250070 [Klebsormidium nitens]|eukprot:GAQ90313.1 hypothetical protein KFL_006250070 [Klebsormidium nitens]